jgi:hypothetical protein
MSPLWLFLIEVGISILSSTLATGFLHARLRRLLIDACGTVERANFWLVYSDAMMFIAPLVVTVIFGKSSHVYAPTLPFFKAALGSALFGIFVALAALGLQLARMLPRRLDDEAAP